MPEPLAWGNLDLPLLGILHDWSGRECTPPAAFALSVDGRSLWFLALHAAPPALHPESTPGKFMPGLWNHDVAECFLSDPNGTRYLELNLAPNGAWWSQVFSSPRIPACAENSPISGVETYSELAADGSWVAAMSIPLATLCPLISFGQTSRCNVNFILGNSPRRFLTAARLLGKSPDFHQPEHFPVVVFAEPPAQ